MDDVVTPDRIDRAAAVGGLHCAGHASFCNACQSSEAAIRAIPSAPAAGTVTVEELAEAVYTHWFEKYGDELRPPVENMAIEAAKVAIEMLKSS